MSRTISPKDAVKVLERNGFQAVTQKGSERKMRHPDGRWTTVPMHRKDLKKGTMRAIEKQSGIKLTDRT